MLSELPTARSKLMSVKVKLPAVKVRDSSPNLPQQDYALVPVKYHPKFLCYEAAVLHVLLWVSFIGCCKTYQRQYHTYKGSLTSNFTGKGGLFGDCQNKPGKKS